MGLVLVGLLHGEAAGQSGGRTIGAWLVESSTDPFDDAVAQSLMYTFDENRSISSMAIACIAGRDEKSIELRIAHPYMIPDEDRENLVQVRFGADEARVVWARAATENKRTDVPMTWRDVEALLATPTLALRITEGASHSNDQYTEVWSDLEGTREAIEVALKPCAPST